MRTRVFIFIFFLLFSSTASCNTFEEKISIIQQQISPISSHLNSHNFQTISFLLNDTSHLPISENDDKSLSIIFELNKTIIIKLQLILENALAENTIPNFSALAAKLSISKNLSPKDIYYTYLNSLQICCFLYLNFLEKEHIDLIVAMKNTNSLIQNLILLYLEQEKRNSQ